MLLFPVLHPSLTQHSGTKRKYTSFQSPETNQKLGQKFNNNIDLNFSHHVELMIRQLPEDRKNLARRRSKLILNYTGRHQRKRDYYCD